MKIQTFSIVAGTRACQGRCPFCVSRMTGFEELPKKRDINVRNLMKAIRLAQLGGTTTVLITGKGEPTLYPTEISQYLSILWHENIPFIELQTNALEIGWLAAGADRKTHLTTDFVSEWYSRGLNTIAISVVGIHTEQNAEVYHPDYPDLATTIKYLHDIGYTVRLCLMMQKGFVDGRDKFMEVIDFCREHGVEQLTARPIRLPAVVSPVDDYFRYTTQHGLTSIETVNITRPVRERGTLLMNLMHGAEVFDVGGQNVCLSDCLTVEPDNDNIRTLIFYSNGRICYDWQHRGAVLLGGH